MHGFILPLAAAATFGAVGRRVAGGWLNQLAGRPDSRPLTGDLPTRIFYGVCIAVAALLGGAAWWLAVLMVPAAWIGTTSGNFHSMAMGRAQTSYLHDVLGMSAHALLSAIVPCLVVLLPSLVVAWHGGPAPPPRWLWLFGLTMTAAPLYSLGWIISGREGRPGFPVGLRGGSELGEAFWGAACGLGAALAFEGT